MKEIIDRRTTDGSFESEVIERDTDPKSLTQSGAGPDEITDPPYPAEKLDHIGWLHGTGDPIGLDDYPSKLYLADDDIWDKGNWVGLGTVGEYADGWGYILFNRTNNWIDGELVLHERGHNLGFRHEDDDGFHEGVMATKEDLSPSVPLDPSTVIPARNTKGFRLFDWEEENIFTIQSLFSLSVGTSFPRSGVTWAWKRYRNTNITDLLMTNKMYEDVDRSKVPDDIPLRPQWWYTSDWNQFE